MKQTSGADLLSLSRSTLISRNANCICELSRRRDLAEHAFSGDFHCWLHVSYSLNTATMSHFLLFSTRSMQRRHPAEPIFNASAEYNFAISLVCTWRCSMLHIEALSQIPFSSTRCSLCNPFTSFRKFPKRKKVHSISPR